MDSIPIKLTTVVNYWPNQPVFSTSPTTAERHIGERPIYKLDSVKQLKSGDFFLVTAKCKRDVPEQLNWDITDVHAAVLQLEVNKHFKNAEWCQSSAGSWLPCDAYVMRDYDDGKAEWPCDLYIKYAMAVTGTALLIVSCHL